MSEDLDRKRRYSEDAEGAPARREWRTEGGTYGNTYISDHASVHLGDRYEQHFYHCELGASKRRDELIASLSFPGMNDRLGSIHEANDGTYTWILDSTAIPERAKKLEQDEMTKFRQWLVDGESIFWISGKPGSGKSSMMKYLSETLSEKARQNGEELHDRQNPIILSYFFWLSGSPLQRSITGCMRSLLVQLLLNNRSRETVLSKIGSGTFLSWTDKNLFTSIQCTLRELHESLLVFIDGLDECDSYDARFDPTRLFTNRSADRLCISSRPEQRFLLKFEGVPYIRMQDVNRYDIEKVVNDDLLCNEDVRTMILRDTSKSLDRDLAKLVSRIQDKAEGVFLWVHLVIRRLVNGIVNCDTIQQLNRRVEGFPSELGDLYRSMLAKYGQDATLYQEEASLYFNLVIHGLDDLTKFCFIDDDLRHRYLHLFQEETALVLENIDVAKIATWIEVRTAGLLQIKRGLFADKKSPLKTLIRNAVINNSPGVQLIVSFIHRTVSDFLLSDEEGIKILGRYSKMSERVQIICQETRIVTMLILPFLHTGRLIPRLIDRSLGGCSKCRNLIRQETLSNLHQLLKQFIHKGAAAVSSSWVISSMELTHRQVCILPSCPYEAVDLVPFLLTQGHVETAKRIMDKHNRWHDLPYTMKLIAPLLSCAFTVGIEPAEKFLQRLSLPVKTIEEAIHSRDEAFSLQVAQAIYHKWPQHYLYLRVRDSYTFKVVQGSIRHLHEVWYYYVHTRGTGHQSSWISSIQLWAAVGIADMLLRIRHLRHSMNPISIGVVVYLSEAGDIQLRAVTPAVSTQILALLIKASLDVYRSGIGVFTLDRRKDIVDTFDEDFKGLLHLLPLVPSFAEAMEHMGKTKSAIYDFYEEEKGFIALEPEETREGWQDWFWGTQDPSYFSKNTKVAI